MAETETEKPRLTEDEVFRALDDKALWGAGPWQDEPDRVEFRHAGMPCVLQRSPFYGAWCGYVAVYPLHPWYGADRYEIDAGEDVPVSVSYAAHDDDLVTCATLRGESSDRYWVGFGYFGANDYGPKFAASLHVMGVNSKCFPYPYDHAAALGARSASVYSLLFKPIYRTLDVAREALEALAEAAKERAK